MKTFGKVTGGGGGLATVIVTVAPAATELPAGGDVESTVPRGVELSIIVTTCTSRPREVSAGVATVTSEPTTFGTCRLEATCVVAVVPTPDEVVVDSPEPELPGNDVVAVLGVAGALDVVVDSSPPDGEPTAITSQIVPPATVAKTMARPTKRGV